MYAEIQGRILGSAIGCKNKNMPMSPYVLRHLFLILERGLECDVFIAVGLVDLYCKCGRLVDARKVFDKMWDKDVAVWNAMVAGTKMWDKMESRGNLLEASCYNVLLEAYAELERTNVLLKVCSMGLDAGTYNILIVVFGEGWYYKEVMTLFNDMVDEKIDPNMETYKGLIVSCGKGGLHEDAKKIVLHMRNSGLVPSSKAYTAIMKAYGQAALYEEAVVTFNTMNELGSVPSVETCNSLIDIFSRKYTFLVGTMTGRSSFHLREKDIKRCLKR
ncbi:pentatricopeptide repeat-containing protein [Tanacetum coccineum]